MPVLENPINTRLEILKTIYRLSGERAGVPIRFFAAQIDGGYYSEIHHQMRFLREKGLIGFTRNIVSKRFVAELTESGLKLVHDAYEALKLEQCEKDQALNEVFKGIKIG